MLFRGLKVDRILVTGGAGYVGAILVPKLLSLGYGVTVLDLFLYADEDIFPREARNSGKLLLMRGDLCRRETVERALEEASVVIHLAGISNDPSSELDPSLTRRVNIEGSKQLITLARAHGVSRFINASSSSVYGIRPEDDVTEDLPLCPLTIYSESKRLIEEYLLEHRGPMVSVSVRSATVCGYSPRMRLDLTVNLLTFHALVRNKITVFGGTQKRPNIHIEDVTDLYAELVDAPKDLIDGRAFNACAANHTVLQLAERVRDTIAPNVPIEITKTDDLRSYHVSAHRIREALGFVPRHSIEEAIRDVARSIEDGRISSVNTDAYYNVRVMKEALKSSLFSNV